MTNKIKNGLTSSEVKELQGKYGKNILCAQKKESFFRKVIGIICEPMFLLLLAAAIIYFILGEARDGAIMLVFVIGIIGIDVVQEWKTDKTLSALKDLSAPHVRVIRDGTPQDILSEDLVPDDIMIISEGCKISADGFVIKCSDLCTDESSLTGEAEGVWKTVCNDIENTPNSDGYWRKDYCYAGTLCIQGSAYILVDKIGSQTEYGKIGMNIASVTEEKTPLKKQTDWLVKICAVLAAVLFVLVSVITYFNISDHEFADRVIESILSGITLSMAMIPEEFPVVLTVFLSMGAWRLAKKSSLVRKLPSVETLGAVSVLCVDKTGTITVNQMTVNKTYAHNADENKLTEIMGLACETDAYDPMEKAILTHCNGNGYSSNDLFDGRLITEYPFTNELKMMGHVWEKSGKIVIAAKGSPERILTLCNLSKDEHNDIIKKSEEMSADGLRVIAAAFAEIETESDIPEKIEDCKLNFLGLTGLSDPPRESVKGDIETCNKAGIRVVMITGDNGVTASSIARQVGMKNCDNIITGDMLNNMDDDELREKVKTVSIFSRVIPEHKMRIVKAFKASGEIVAMTGDGVNDAPALKAADIGIAMGKRGSEVSREAADLILLDDNFTTIVETVHDGRRIYDNIRKAVGYIFSIHIPIAMASLLAPMLGVAPSALLLLPLHIVILELVIDPTCSIVLERQPAETDIMERNPRNPKEKLLTARQFMKSVLQGFVIFMASFGAYLYVYKSSDNAEIARTMGLGIIMLANLFLVQVNSSDRDFVLNSMKKLAKDKVMCVVSAVTILALAIIIYSPLNSFLKLAPLDLAQVGIMFLLAAVSVFWYEIIKAFKRYKHK